MASQKKIMKLFILIILAVFLLSSGLVSVMYFADMNKKVPADDTSSDSLTTDTTLQEPVSSGTVLLDTGATN